MNRKYPIIKKIVSFVILVLFTESPLTVPQVGYAQNLANLPAAGAMVSSSAPYRPAIISGITVYPKNPLQFDFIVDTGDDQLQGAALEDESKRLINYFFASLTVPEQEMWVNLSPYEEDRIIASGLAETEMGRDMLIQDYLLKQFTASLMYPEEEIGQRFWKKVYAKTQAQFGTTEIPTNTFNKVWIVPEEAQVYVSDSTAFVVHSHLKVMLEQDYLALEHNAHSVEHGVGDVSDQELDTMSQQTAEIIRQILIPEIEHEINHGKNFANLRQLYHSMILATWYKKILRNSFLSESYFNRNKTAGVDVVDEDVKVKIYNQYVAAFKEGVYNYIREEPHPDTKEIVLRKYFSGGLERVKSVSSSTVSPSPEWVRGMAGRSHTRFAVKGSLRTEGSSGSSGVSSEGYEIAQLDLEPRTQRSLIRHGLTTIKQLEGIMEPELLALEGFGLTRVDEVKRALSTVNKSLKPIETDLQDLQLSEETLFKLLYFGINSITDLVARTDDELSRLHDHDLGKLNLAEIQRQLMEIKGLVLKPNEIEITFTDLKLSDPTRDQLIQFDLNTISKLRRITEDELRLRYNFDANAIEEIRAALQEINATLRPRDVEFYNLPMSDNARAALIKDGIAVIKKLTNHTENELRVLLNSNSELFTEITESLLTQGLSLQLDPLEGELHQLSLSVRTIETLAVGGITTIAELRSKEEADLLKIPNLGLRGIREVKEALFEKELFLRYVMPELDELGLSPRAKNLLGYFGITTLQELKDKTESEFEDLLSNHENSLEEITSVFLDSGYSFKKLGLDGLPLSQHTKDVLHQAGIHTISELLQKTDEDLLALPEFGEHHLYDEVRPALLALRASSSPGGIDFNPQALDFDEQGIEIDFEFSDDIFQNIQPSSVQGIVPVIINVQPVTNFPMLLGLENEPDANQLTSL